MPRPRSASSRRCPAVELVVNAGAHKAAVRLAGGPQVDLMVMPPGACGTYLVHFTGSKEHNVRLRGIARDRGWSLSEKGFARLAEDGEIATGADAELRTCATEAEVYAFLGLAEVPPELREDRGEVEAARERPSAAAGGAGRPAGRLPRPLGLVRRDPHDRADGGGRPRPAATVPGAHRPLPRPGHRARPRRRSAWRRSAASSPGSTTASPARRPLGRRRPETPPGGFRLLHGCELEIRGDGVARLRRRPARVVRRRRRGAPPGTAPAARAADRARPGRHRAAPTWTSSPIRRAGCSASGRATTSTSPGTRSSPPPRPPGRSSRSTGRTTAWTWRPSVRAGRSRPAACSSIDSDAHRIEELAGIAWGVAQARRAWVEPAVVANTWSAGRRSWPGSPARPAESSEARPAESPKRSSGRGSRGRPRDAGATADDSR